MRFAPQGFSGLGRCCLGGGLFRLLRSARGFSLESGFFCERMDALAFGEGRRHDCRSRGRSGSEHALRFIPNGDIAVAGASLFIPDHLGAVGDFLMGMFHNTSEGAGISADAVFMPEA